MGRMHRDIDSHHFLGPVKSRVTYFNGSMTWMKGKALVKSGEEDLFCEFEGDPNFIERRFGGNVKRSREKAIEEDNISNQDEEETRKRREQKTLPESNRQPKTQGDEGPHEIRVVPTPKRSRVSDPLGLTQGCLDDALLHCPVEGPSRNTRSRASSSLRGRGHRAPLIATSARKGSGNCARKISLEKGAGRKGKGKGKAVAESDQVAEITAGIDGFSVFSNLQIEEDVQALNLTVTGNSNGNVGGMDAGEWAKPVTHATKVGVWLEKTAEAGSQVPVDAPQSRAPSSIAGVALA